MLGTRFGEALVESPHQQGRAPFDQGGPKVVGSVVVTDLDLVTGVDRAGVEPLLEEKCRGARHLIPREHRVLDRGRSAPGRQQREVQVDPAARGDVEHGARHESAVRHDRAAVRRELPQLLLELLLARVPRRQDRDAVLEGQLLHRRRRQGAAATRPRIGAGDHADDVVTGAEQCRQRRQGRGRGAGEDESQVARPKSG